MCARRRFIRYRGPFRFALVNDYTSFRSCFLSSRQFRVLRDPIREPATGYAEPRSPILPIDRLFAGRDEEALSGFNDGLFTSCLRVLFGSAVLSARRGNFFA